ncbi:MAG: putative F420-dependent oxidoreductase [Paracrocinitomix sp.]|jgi:probable F420-dependent oxidoreductase
MPQIKFGLFLPTGDYHQAETAAKWADDSGFHSVSLNDHFISQDGGTDAPQLECLSTLTAIAAVTSNVRLVPSVLAASHRTPAMLAKMTATIDNISRGRFTLGIGAGWNQAEYLAHGYRFPPATERLDRLAETIQVVKAMWTQDDACYSGRHEHIEHASSLPRPVQQPHPPIMIGGSSKHLLKIAAEHADIVNLIPPTANGKDFIKDAAATVRFDRARLRQRIELLHQLFDDAERDPATVELSGFVLANISTDENHPRFERLATRLGFDSLDAARRSPVALIGTPEQVIEELHDRAERDGIRYFIVVATSLETQELLADEIIPAFTAS